jgi:lysozyme
MPTIRSTSISLLLASAGLVGAFNLADKYEGLPQHNGVAYRYIDAVGVPTICRGTTTGPLVKRGYATIDECDAQTVKDLKVAWATVQRCMHGPMTQGEKDAWTSFANNVGPGGRGVKDGMCMLKSGRQPSHVSLFNSGKHRAACAKLFDWTQPGTPIHRGLLKRRTDEYATCIKDLPGDAQ